MVDLKTVVLMLLNGDEVIITDDLGNCYEVNASKLADGVDYKGETTLVIRSERLGGE